MTYEWDAVKAAANIKKHRITIISARRATRQEQRQYEEGIDATSR